MPATHDLTYSVFNFFFVKCFLTCPIIVLFFGDDLMATIHCMNLDIDVAPTEDYKNG